MRAFWMGFLTGVGIAIVAHFLVAIWVFETLIESGHIPGQ